VVKSYAGQVVLHLERLSMPSGGLLGIIGPSAAGKSTLLRLLAMLERPDQGTVLWDGSSAWSLARRRQITLLLPRPQLFRGTVAENVAYGLAIRGVRRRLLRQKVDAALELVGVELLRQRLVHTLSSGEAQRVALARALAISPRALLLDEPTANLDPFSAAAIEQTLREVNAAGTTVVLVTHNLFQARRLARHVALLWEGQLVEEGPVEQLFTTPRDEVTRRYVQGETVY